ncbi:uncharacterized protein LOC126374206 [Pectinophora gossypiella]|uniref:uncharacterized protein LOC126374206 n=1 Tax=Pectinophora gossypiella TaxID=13191 RepID=UPI00214EF9D2|nr:uncharacterized protein LOC126374206 [Pectinophora gossypiella]
MQQDSLVRLSVEKWSNLQEAFMTDWPRGISGYTILDTQRRWLKEGFDYGFKVFCPFGDLWSGMVAINEKDAFYEIVIQCPRNDTSKLEEALKTTNVIDWQRNIIIPFAPSHIIESVKKIAEDVNVDIELILPSNSFILDKQSPQFDVSLPSSITFGLLTPKHVELVDSTWPHRYPGSTWYFQLLVKTRSGFGLFKDQDLVSWVFINEAGTLGHMYTLEDHRRKSYGELLLKLVSNVLLKEWKDVFAFSVKGNESACNLYRKVGFKNFDGVAWCYLKGKSK